MFGDEEEYRALKEILNKLDRALEAADEGASVDPGLTRDEYVRLSALLSGSDLFDPKVREQLLAKFNKATSH